MNTTRKINTESQLQITKMEFEMCQRQMDKYDDLSGKIKTWAATLWGASMGWSFQTRNKELLLLGLVLIVTFGLIDTVNKNFRTNYKRRRNEVARALNEYFKIGEWPKDFTSPEPPPHRDIEMKIVLKPHISIFYTSLFILSLITFFVI